MERLHEQMYDKICSTEQKVNSFYIRSLKYMVYSCVDLIIIIIIMRSGSSVSNRRNSVY